MGSLFKKATIRVGFENQVFLRSFLMCLSKQTLPMNIDEISFPAMSFVKAGYILFMRDQHDLIICNGRGFKNGFYKNLKIIDSEGKKFDILNAEKTGTFGGFMGYTILLERLFKVKLIFKGEYVKIGLEEFKDKMLNILKKDELYWTTGGDLPEFISFIKKSTSFHEIINRLTNDFYKEHK